MDDNLNKPSDDQNKEHDVYGTLDNDKKDPYQQPEDAQHIYQQNQEGYQPQDGFGQPGQNYNPHNAYNQPDQNTDPNNTYNQPDQTYGQNNPYNQPDQGYNQNNLYNQPGQGYGQNNTYNQQHQGYNQSNYQQPPQGYNQNNYQQPPQGDWRQQQASKQNQNNGFSIASMVVGILSILCICTVYLSIVLGVAGIILAIVSRGPEKKMSGFAKAGLICSIVGISLTLIVIVLSVLSYSDMFMDELIDDLYYYFY